MVFEIKAGCKLDLQAQETMELLRSTEKKIDKDKNSEHVPKLEIVKVVFMHCNVFDNDYKKASKLLFTFVPNKQIEQLINISSHLLTMLNTTNTEFLYIEVIKIANLLK